MPSPANNRLIDLYSDTQTKPSPGMRKAMAEADVGDEQRGEDPTTNLLQDRVADLLMLFTLPDISEGLLLLEKLS